MQKIIVVGNGTSLLDKKNGSLIDSYEEVVRFNEYETKKYEENVGSKTTIWFNVINFTNKPAQWRLGIPYKKIYLHSWQWDKNKDALYKDFINFMPQAKNIYKTESSDLMDLVNYSGIDKKEYYCYSTGLFAIWILLKEYSQLTITGFDWWERTEHHYFNAVKKGNLHKPDIEKKVIDKLVNDKKVIFL